MTARPAGYRPGMTVTELRHALPSWFHPQTWYVGERFMGYLPEVGAGQHMPTVGTRGDVPTSNHGLPRAVDLVHTFLRHPLDPGWALYWWTADTDGLGQRVYVGGATRENHYRLEIHRHLAISDRWVTPLAPDAR